VIDLRASLPTNHSSGPCITELTPRTDRGIVASWHRGSRNTVACRFKNAAGVCALRRHRRPAWGLHPRHAPG
jgi:hypothetical protein